MLPRWHRRMPKPRRRPNASTSPRSSTGTPSATACATWPARADLSHHRWTVDTPEDYERWCDACSTAFVLAHPASTQADVLALLDTHPDWVAINQHIQQKPATDTQKPTESTP